MGFSAIALCLIFAFLGIGSVLYTGNTNNTKTKIEALTTSALLIVMICAVSLIF